MMMLRQLPTISFKQLHRREERARLRVAASEVGFFYLVDHGLSATQLNDVMTVSRKFFALSQAEKTAIAMSTSRHFRGYNAVGQERTAGALDRREQFDWMNEEPSRQSFTADWEGLIGPNLWPENLPQLRHTLLAFTDAQTHIAIGLLRALCACLGVAADALDHTFNNAPYTHSKIIKYPGSDVARQGVGAHKDPGYLTFVLQDQHSGLQVEHENHWIDVKPLPGSLVVNIGELLELASDGVLQATHHRVLAPENGFDRYSVAYFMAAQLDATVPVLPLSEVMKGGSKRVSSDPNNPLLRQVGKNVLKGRIRSHPAAAHSFYQNQTVDTEIGVPEWNLKSASGDSMSCCSTSPSARIRGVMS
ncbi:MAG: isopenicillin N synthase family dioxygenase [Pseudomonadota bacterium]